MIKKLKISTSHIFDKTYQWSEKKIYAILSALKKWTKNNEI